MSLRVAMVSAEVVPWAWSGGLGDVVGALPAALQATGSVEPTIFMPLHKAVRANADRLGRMLAPTEVSVDLPIGDRRIQGRFWRWDRVGEPAVCFLEADELFDLEQLYTYARGSEDTENLARFTFFCRAVRQGAAALMGGAPDILHAHDWMTAPAVIELHQDADPAWAKTRTVFTIHNLAYQGRFPRAEALRLGMKVNADLEDPADPSGTVNLVKAALATADAVSTVSARYAAEIRTPTFGAGLDKWINEQARPITGILNGIDTRSWDPSADLFLPATYGHGRMAGKAFCREALVRSQRLRAGTGDLVLGMVARLVDQKGLDLVAPLVRHLPGLGASLVILGEGDPAIEAELTALARDWPHHLSVHVGFDLPASHRIYAGSDAFLVPSRFEPCGLTQLYAMRYGSVPIVHATGGLADTVHDPGDREIARGEGTGFAFHRATADDLAVAVARAARIFREEPEAWRGLVARGMARDHSWARPASATVSLYQGVLARG